MKLTYMPPVRGMIEVSFEGTSFFANLDLQKKCITFYNCGEEEPQTLTAEELEEMLAKLKEATK